MPYVTELVVGICVVRSQSDSCLREKQRSGGRDSVSWHACHGRAPAGVLCEGCCVSAGCTGTVEGCSCRISCLVIV